MTEAENQHQFTGKQYTGKEYGAQIAGVECRE